MRKVLLAIFLLASMSAITTNSQTIYQPTGFHITNYSFVDFYYRLSDGTGMTVELDSSDCTFSIAYGTAQPDPQGVHVTSCTTTTTAPYVYVTIPQTTLSLTLANGGSLQVSLAPTTWQLLRTATWRGAWKYTMMSYRTGITVE
jgi:hypothetical protein